MHIYDDKVYFFSHTQFSLLLLNVLAFIWDVLLLRVHVLSRIQRVEWLIYVGIGGGGCCWSDIEEINTKTFSICKIFSHSNINNIQRGKHEKMSHSAMH